MREFNRQDAVDAKTNFHFLKNRIPGALGGLAVS